MELVTARKAAGSLFAGLLFISHAFGNEGNPGCSQQCSVQFGKCHTGVHQPPQSWAVPDALRMEARALQVFAAFLGNAAQNEYGGTHPRRQ